MIETVRRAAERAPGSAHAMLERRRPDVAVEVLTRLGAGGTVMATAAELGIDKDTVSRVRARNREWVDEERERQMVTARGLATKIMLAVQDEAEALADPERRGKVGIKDLTIAGAIWLDKAERLSDRADVRLEVRVTVPSLEACREALEEARALAGERVVAGRVVEGD